MDSGIRTSILREQSGRVSEIRFMHHPGAIDFKEIMEKAVMGGERTSGIAVVDGMMIFSYGDTHIPALGEHDALMEMYVNIVRGNACMMPLNDAFLDGIIIAVR